MSDDRKDLPPVTSPNFLEKVREAVQTYLGNRGATLDRGITLRDLTESGLVTLRANFGKGSSNPIGGPGALIIDNVVYEPDLTPPPTPSGFAATAAISNLLVECGSQTYTQGHGHAKSRLYGATWTSGALPVFADAVLLTEFSGAVASHATNPGTTWHLWLTWVTVDGVESTSPAGGTNGVVTRTGEDVSALVKAMTGVGNPFTILPMTTIIGGVTFPAGTYSTQAFIQDAQITTAKIKDLAVDNAKIASLSAAKLTIGDGTVGGNLKSADYIPGSQGWMIPRTGSPEFSNGTFRGNIYATAGYLRGVEIQDAGGNVILSSGSTLAAQVNAKTRANPNLVRSLKTWSHSGTNWVTTQSVHTADGHTLVIPSGQNYVSSNSPAMNLSDGTEWVISFTAWATSPRWLSFDLYPDTLPGSGVMITTEYRKQYSFVWSSSHADRSNCVLRFFAGTEPGQIEIGEIKLEKANTRTIWTPHFLDNVTVSNPITSSNVSTYIASAAIGNAQIGGNIYSDNYYTSGGTAGWLLDRAGNLTANTGTFGGNVHGGQFTTGAYTKYVWPAAGSYGTYLGPSGLLIGNANNGKYFQITADGNIYSPGFNIENGSMTVTQANVIKTLNIAGNAVSVQNAASGSATSVSTNVWVPSGVTAQVYAIGTAASGSAMSYDLTLNIHGSVFNTLVSGVIQSDGEGHWYNSPPACLANVVSVTGPATVWATVSGLSVSKTISMIATFR